MYLPLRLLCLLASCMRSMSCLPACLCMCTRHKQRLFSSSLLARGRGVLCYLSALETTCTLHISKIYMCGTNPSSGGDTPAWRDPPTLLCSPLAIFLLLLLLVPRVTLRALHQMLQSVALRCSCSCSSLPRYDMICAMTG